MYVSQTSVRHECRAKAPGRRIINELTVIRKKNIVMVRTKIFYEKSSLIPICRETFNNLVYPALAPLGMLVSGQAKQG